MTRALFLLLALGMTAAHAQNKCVDARGRITYQEDPCPGTPRSALPKPAPPASPSTPSATAPAAPSEAPPPAAPAVNPRVQELQTELGELERCTGQWETTAGALQGVREDATARVAKGGNVSRPEATQQPYVQFMIQQLLSTCGKYGFVNPVDFASAARNEATAQELRRKQQDLRAQLDAAKR
jgi:hypothetical protein